MNRSAARRTRSIATVATTGLLAVAAAVAVAGPAGAAPSVPMPIERLNAARGAGAPVLAAGARAATATTPVPPTPGGLPSAIEPLSPYIPQVACDPTPKPGAVALGQLLTSTYPGTSYGISRTCGTDGMSTSEHYEGRAVDWMNSVRVPAQAAQANAVLGWLFAKDSAGNSYANARRLGIMYIIWNNQIWGAYAASAGWRPYLNCASHPESSWDTTCHRDHIHFSLGWAGAMKRTSFWSRQVASTDYGPCRPADLNWAALYTRPNASPCPSYPKVAAPNGSSATYAAEVKYSGVVLAQGGNGPAVAALQGGLDVPADGAFGPITAAALRNFQSSHGLAATGVADAATWRALLAAGSPSGQPTAGMPRLESPRYRYNGSQLRFGVRPK